MAWAIPRPKKGSTIFLEAVADQETWIWHAFFGMPGSLNDINVVNRSPLMNKIANGELPPVQFVANGRTYNYGYYLADGIYPKWQTFVKPLKKPEGKKNLDFHNAQAAARKDVERAFGILQAQFAIVRGPARFWDQKMLWYIMHACVIMHNMIIENERGQDVDYSQYELLGHPVRVGGGLPGWPVLLPLKEICPRGNNKVVIYIFLYHENVYYSC